MKNPAPKVEIGLGKLLFANVNHDMMYSIDSPHKQKGENCSSTNDNDLDQCVINVMISITLNKIMSLGGNNSNLSFRLLMNSILRNMDVLCQLTPTNLMKSHVL